MGISPILFIIAAVLIVVAIGGLLWDEWWHE